MLGDADRCGENAANVQRRVAESPFAREERVLLDGAANLVANLQPFIELRLRKNHHELVAAVTRHRGVVDGDDALEEKADFAQHLTSGQMSVAVVDYFESIEIHEDQYERLAASARVGERFAETHVEPAIVEKSCEVVAFRQLVR